MAARLIVTLPPAVSADEALAFAAEAHRRGAGVLELRTDLHAPDALPVAALARVLPLLVAERERPIPEAWRASAELVDRELGDHQGATLISRHAPAPLTPSDAVASWERAAPGPAVWIKHVEPLGPPEQAKRLFETQTLLLERFGPRVTVLATGDCALPFRAALSERNALDYVAFTARFRAAPGQRLLADAVRAQRGTAPGRRLGILGTAIEHSRSPRLHPPPFDRVELPESAPVGALIDALHPHYRGFAVTSPFKIPLARHLNSELPAINTLVRTEIGWSAHNTDVDGAHAVLARLGPQVAVLGAGGATVALRMAAERLGTALTVIPRDEAQTTLTTPAVWTWPPRVAAPERLRFAGTQVAVIAYGGAARPIEAEIRARGGIPVRAGARWLIAQARAQRIHWESAT